MNDNWQGMDYKKTEVYKVFAAEGGIFQSDAPSFIEKMKPIRAFVFDWDGVFNNGEKKGSEGSPFNETDSMGVNLLRYSHYRIHGNLPLTAIISGMNNPPASHYAQREHFDACYLDFKDKSVPLQHLSEKYDISPSEVAYFFDDVLDIRLARICGLRLQLKHPGSHLFNHFVRTNQAADYTTANEGGKGGLREVCELLIGLNGNYEEVLHARIDYTGDYESYFKLRQSVQSAFFVHHEGQVMPAN